MLEKKFGLTELAKPTGKTEAALAGSGRDRKVQITNIEEAVRLNSDLADGTKDLVLSFLHGDVEDATLVSAIRDKFSSFWVLRQIVDVCHDTDPALADRLRVVLDTAETVSRADSVEEIDRVLRQEGKVGDYDFLLSLYFAPKEVQEQINRAMTGDNQSINELQALIDANSALRYRLVQFIETMQQLGGYEAEVESMQEYLDFGDSDLSPTDLRGVIKKEVKAWKEQSLHNQPKQND